MKLFYAIASMVLFLYLAIKAAMTGSGITVVIVFLAGIWLSAYFFYQAKMENPVFRKKEAIKTLDDTYYILNGDVWIIECTPEYIECLFKVTDCDGENVETIMARVYNDGEIEEI